MSSQDSKYWAVKFATVPYQVYAYGVSPLTAISEASQELGREDLGGALVRPAVYKEWSNGPEHYTNGGQFIEDTRKPCRECSEPVEFHTHKTELGFCIDCSWKYWNHQLDN